MQVTQATIIGYGSQAKAWAANLKDSGLQVNLLLRPESPSISQAKNAGLDVFTFEDELEQLGENFIFLTPDDSHHLIAKELSKKLDLNQKNFIYAHGYSYLRYDFEKTYPEVNHLLLAPKAIASELRERYLSQENLVAVLSDPKGKSSELLEVLSNKLGITKKIQATFKDETWADLFSEQSVLCSLLPYGARKSFDFLIDKGIHPEVAFTECWMEVKLIADAMLKFGPEGFFKLISPNALIGGEKAQKLIFDNEYQKKLDSLWKDISSGQFDSQVDETKANELRQQVLDDWKKSKLPSVYDEFYKDQK